MLAPARGRPRRRDFEHQWAVNARAPFLVARAFLPAMREAGGAATSPSAASPIIARFPRTPPTRPRKFAAARAARSAARGVPGQRDPVHARVAGAHRYRGLGSGESRRARGLHPAPRHAPPGRRGGRGAGTSPPVRPASISTGSGSAPPDVHRADGPSALSGRPRRGVPGAAPRCRGAARRAERQARLSGLRLGDDHQPMASSISVEDRPPTIPTALSAEAVGPSWDSSGPAATWRWWPVRPRSPRSWPRHSAACRSCW